MVLATERGLGAAREELDRETLLDIDEALTRARNSVATSPKADAAERDLQGARDELERATLPLAALLMDNVAKSALSGKTLDEV